MEREKRNLTRITINVPVELIREIDTYAIRKGITRTAAIALICGDYFDKNPNKK